MHMEMTDKYLKEALSEYCEEEWGREEVLDDIEVSDDFKKKMELLVNSVDKKKQRSKHIFNMRWAAAVVTLLVIAGALLVGMDRNARAGCFDFIRQLFTGGYNRYQAVEHSNDDDEREITGFTMNYIPDGYELVSEQTSDLSYMFYDYKSKNGSIHFMYYKNTMAADTMINNEYVEHTTVKLEDGTRCEYYTDNGADFGSCMLWKKGNYVCFLSRQDGDEEIDLVKIADNITPKYK